MASILVLEDDTDMRESIVEALEESSHQAFGAASCQEALALAARKSFDLVVFDVRMPGPDGLECMETLSRRCPNLPCILITGYAEEQAPLRAVRLQVRDYLYKPFTLPALLQSVRRALQAEQERSAYQRLLDGLKSLLERTSSARLNADLATLDHKREQAFQSFYTGLRSGMLSPREALGIWTRLASLEAERERFKEGKLDAPARQALAEGYSRLVELICSVRQRGQLERDSRVPAERFSLLCKAIQSGAVSLEELKLAPFLWSLDPAILKQSPELTSLYARLWGTA